MQAAIHTTLTPTSILCPPGNAMRTIEALALQVEQRAQVQPERNAESELSHIAELGYN